MALPQFDLTGVPAELVEEIEQLNKQFWVSTPVLNKIIEKFISELDRGLSYDDMKDDQKIPMNVSWVMDYPDGSETGDYLAIDLGGTNLRVVMVHLLGNNKFTTEQSKYHIPVEYRSTKNRDDLFDFIAKCLEEFITEQNPEGVPEGKIFPLGFTFSFPATQSSISTGVLQRWTKGFDIPNVEGHDVVEILETSIKKKNLPIKIVALINDTSGTLVASRYTDPLTEMGCIFGTGVNGAYYDRLQNIKKLEGKLENDIPSDSPMLINCEYGSFDNANEVLPRTKYDLAIDSESPRPGQQAFEKMTSGYYLGELLRKIMLEAYEKKLIFKNYTKTSQQYEFLSTPYRLDTSFLSIIEADTTDNLNEALNLFSRELFIDTTLEERKFAKRVSQFIGTRAARISICGIAAVCKKMDYKVCHIAADGSVYLKYPYFAERAAGALADVYGWDKELPIEEHPIQIVHAQDGSGVGAAVIAALSDKRQKLGLSLGLKSSL